jgi:hypothetical protein
VTKSFREKSKQSPTTAAPDHLAAGAADLRSRAKACRITADDVAACRRLEAAAELLAPESDEGAEALTVPVKMEAEGGSSQRRSKSRKPRRAAEVAPEAEDDAELDDIEFDADLDDEEA